MRWQSSCLAPAPQNPASGRLNRSAASQRAPLRVAVVAGDRRLVGRASMCRLAPVGASGDARSLATFRLALLAGEISHHLTWGRGAIEWIPILRTHARLTDRSVCEDAAAYRKRGRPVCPESDLGTARTLSDTVHHRHTEGAGYQTRTYASGSPERLTT